MESFWKCRHIPTNGSLARRDDFCMKSLPKVNLINLSPISRSKADCVIHQPSFVWLHSGLRTTRFRLCREVRLCGRLMIRMSLSGLGLFSYLLRTEWTQAGCLGRSFLSLPTQILLL